MTVLKLRVERAVVAEAMDPHKKPTTRVQRVRRSELPQTQPPASRKQKISRGHAREEVVVVNKKDPRRDDD